eukprot:scaffold13215_cov114-Cylindrotheca_fusiformis.AAC.6
MVLNPNYNEDHDWEVCSAPSSAGNDEDSNDNDDNNDNNWCDDDSEADDNDEVSEQTNDWTIPTVIANDETTISDSDSKLLLSKTDQEKEHTWNPTATTTTTTTSTPPPSLRFRRTAAVHTIQKAGQKLGSTIQGVIGKSNSSERPTQQQQQPKKEPGIAVIAAEKQSVTAIILKCLGYVVSVASVIGGGIMFLKGQRHVGALLLATAGGTLWGTEQTWNRRQKKNSGWFP